MRLNYDMALLLQNYDDQYRCAYIEGMESQHCIHGACMRFRSVEQCVCKDMYFGPNCDFSTGMFNPSTDVEAEESSTVPFIGLQQYWVTTISMFVLIAFTMFCVGILFGKKNAEKNKKRPVSLMKKPVNIKVSGNSIKDGSMQKMDLMKSDQNVLSSATIYKKLNQNDK